MHENINNLQCRLYLETAKFHYKQMALNIQDKDILIYCLLAFLPIARSVTLVFQKEFHGNEELMNWYASKVKEWENNKVLKFFIDMRNISLKEHPLIMLTRELVPLSVFLPSSANYDRKEVHASDVEIVSYIFELPEHIDENPEVMNLCLRYLDELEDFVIEAENIVRKEGMSNGQAVF